MAANPDDSSGEENEAEVTVEVTVEGANELRAPSGRAVSSDAVYRPSTGARTVSSDAIYRPDAGAATRQDSTHNPLGGGRAAASQRPSPVFEGAAREVEMSDIGRSPEVLDAKRKAALSDASAASTGSSGSATTTGSGHPKPSMAKSPSILDMLKKRGDSFAQLLRKPSGAANSNNTTLGDQDDFEFDDLSQHKKQDGRFGMRFTEISPKLDQCKEMINKWKEQIQESHPCFKNKIWFKAVPLPYVPADKAILVWQFSIGVGVFLLLFIIALAAGLAPKPAVTHTPPDPFAIISVGASMKVVGMSASEFGSDEQSAFATSVQSSVQDDVDDDTVSNSVEVVNVAATDSRRRRTQYAHYSQRPPALEDPEYYTSKYYLERYGQGAQVPKRFLASTDIITVTFDVVIECRESSRSGWVDSIGDTLATFAVSGASSSPSDWDGTALEDTSIDSDSLEVDEDWSTVNPTLAPTTPSPTYSVMPSDVPTPVPSAFPTPAPSSSPSRVPSARPTPLPSTTPLPTTPAPSPLPTISFLPTAQPSPLPTTVPTPVPSLNPSALPTPLPSSVPTPSPTTSSPTTSRPTVAVVAVGEACETHMIGGFLQPLCESGLACVHVEDDPSLTKSQQPNMTECVDCSMPQFGYDCPYWTQYKRRPAEALCASLGYEDSTCDLPSVEPTPSPSVLPTAGNVSKLGEACETRTDSTGALVPQCSTNLVCVHYDQDTAQKAQKSNKTECVQCSDPQWSWDCHNWDWQLRDPAEEACGRTCDSFPTKGKTDYYYDEFNDFNPSYFYRDLPCVDYASWPEDGNLVIAIDDWGNDAEYYGGCVYGQTLHGSGNYSATMAPFSRTDTGFVSAFYMYSDDDDYYNHDEIDFEFRSQSYGSYDSAPCVWTNVFTDYNPDYHWGKSEDVCLDSDSRFNWDDQSQTEDHEYRLEYVQGEYIKWFVDGLLIREERDFVPTKKMNVRFSIFYLDNYWGGYLDKSLLPVTVSFDSMTFTYDSADDEDNCNNKDTDSVTNVDPTGCDCYDWYYDRRDWDGATETTYTSTGASRTKYIDTVPRECYCGAGYVDDYGYCS